MNIGFPNHADSFVNLLVWQEMSLVRTEVFLCDNMADWRNKIFYPLLNSREDVPFFFILSCVLHFGNLPSRANGCQGSFLSSGILIQHRQCEDMRVSWWHLRQPQVLRWQRSSQYPFNNQNKHTGHIISENTLPSISESQVHLAERVLLCVEELRLLMVLRIEFLRN